MPQLVEVSFKGKRRELFSNPRGIQLEVGDYAVVDAERGESLGTVTRVQIRTKKKKLKGPVRTVQRKATPEDLKNLREILDREKRFFEVCKTKIAEKGLPMKLVDVEAQFDGNKTTFFFTAEGRVDFRSLVKELAQTFRTRIELRQIGVRDHARRLGGLGVCGLERCCASVLREFEPVTLKMARDQHLALSPSKISGVCGRLMCCLAYEHGFYVGETAQYPRLGANLQGPDGVVTVDKVDYLREVIHLEGDDGNRMVLSREDWEKRKGEWREVSEGPSSDERATEGRGSSKARRSGVEG